MDSKDVLGQAVTIARDAHKRASEAEIEANVCKLEQSENRAMRSLAHVYRMLQRPPYQ
jgi:hypothetical protein